MATAKTNAGGTPIYFWREIEHPYGFLSQWYLSPFSAPSHPNAKSDEMVTFVTTEQYMMYGKAMVFGDKEIAAKIMMEPSAKKQKALGRKVKGFDNQTWNAHREKIVEEGNWWKFTSDKGQDMAKLLLETGDRLLVEVTIHYPFAIRSLNKRNFRPRHTTGSGE